MTKLARENKVLLTFAHLLGLSSKDIEDEKAGVDEAFRLQDEMSEVFERSGISHVVIKSFDSLPDVGHDIDFLVHRQAEMERARDLLMGSIKARTQALTHCDKLLRKLS